MTQEKARNKKVRTEDLIAEALSNINEGSASDIVNILFSKEVDKRKKTSLISVVLKRMEKKGLVETPRKVGRRAIFRLKSKEKPKESKIKIKKEVPLKLTETGDIDHIDKEFAKIHTEIIEKPISISKEKFNYATNFEKKILEILDNYTKSTASSIANEIFPKKEQIRKKVSKISVYLKRMEKKGFVKRSNKIGRNAFYYITKEEDIPTTLQKIEKPTEYEKIAESYLSRVKLPKLPSEMPKLPRFAAPVGASILVIIFITIYFIGPTGFLVTETIQEKYIEMALFEAESGIYEYNIENIYSRELNNIIAQIKLPKGTNIEDFGEAEIEETSDSILLKWFIDNLSPEKKKRFTFKAKTLSQPVIVSATALTLKEYEDNVDQGNIQFILNPSSREYNSLSLRPTGYMSGISIDMKIAQLGTKLAEETTSITGFMLSNITEEIEEVEVEELSEPYIEIPIEPLPIEEIKIVEEIIEPEVIKEIPEIVEEVIEEEIQEDIPEVEENITEEIVEQPEEIIEEPIEEVTPIEQPQKIPEPVPVIKDVKQKVTSLEIYLDRDNEWNGNEDLIGKGDIYENEILETLLNTTNIQPNKYTEETKLVFFSENGVVMKINNLKIKWAKEILVNVSEEAEINSRNETTEIVEEEVIQYQAVIGKPVKWKKTVKVDRPSKNVTVELPKDITNISVKKIVENVEIKIGKEKIKILEDGIEKEITETNLMTGQVTKKTENVIDKFLSDLIKMTGFATYEEEENIELIVEDDAEEVEVEYYTEGPQLIEQEISESKKRAVVSSDIHYENILAFIEIPEGADAKVYHVDGFSRQEVQSNLIDSNNDGKKDLVEWIVPHLSEQEYEIELTIINIQAYPELGGNWTVFFNTTGTADLNITKNNKTFHEMTFDFLKCGEDVVEPIIDGPSVFVPNWNCDGKTSQIEHTVNTSGDHLQYFKFGDIEIEAHNAMTGCDAGGLGDCTGTCNGLFIANIPNWQYNAGMSSCEDSDDFLGTVYSLDADCVDWIGLADSDCATYFDEGTLLTIGCPSYDALGAAVDGDDCKCMGPASGWGWVACPNYGIPPGEDEEDYIDFENEFFAGGAPDPCTMTESTTFQENLINCTAAMITGEIVVVTNGYNFTASQSITVTGDATLVVNDSSKVETPTMLVFGGSFLNLSTEGSNAPTLLFEGVGGFGASMGTLNSIGTSANPVNISTNMSGAIMNWAFSTFMNVDLEKTVVEYPISISAPTLTTTNVDIDNVGNTGIIIGATDTVTITDTNITVSAGAATPLSTSKTASIDGLRIINGGVNNDITSDLAGVFELTNSYFDETNVVVSAASGTIISDNHNGVTNDYHVIGTGTLWKSLINNIPTSSDDIYIRKTGTGILTFEIDEDISSNNCYIYEDVFINIDMGAEWKFSGNVTKQSGPEPMFGIYDGKITNVIINETSFNVSGESFNVYPIISKPTDTGIYKNISRYVNFTNITPSSSWAFVNITYDSTTMDESTLVLTEYNGTDWVLVTGSSVDTTNNYVYGNATSFSPFAPMGVGNNPPTHTTPSLIATDNPNNFTTANLTCTNQTTADADGDVVTNIYNWYKNDSSITVINMGFDQDNSTNTKDYSGRGNDGLLASGSLSPVWISSGRIGGAYNFTGTEYINISDDPSFDLGTEGTIMLWFKTNIDDVVDTNDFLLDADSSDTQRWYLLISTGDKIRGKFENTTGEDIGGATYRQINSDVADKTWHHAALVYDGNNNTLYLDGGSGGTATRTFPGQTFASITGSVFIGSKSDKTKSFDGLIDDVRVYNIGLTATQVEQIYEDTKNGFSSTSTITSAQTNVTDDWKCEVTPNDAEDDGTTSNSTSLTILSDTTPPKWLSNTSSCNAANLYTGTTCQFQVKFIDEIGTGFYALSYNVSGESDLVNDTFTTWINDTTRLVNKDVVATRGEQIYWKWYVNDSSNNWNTTDQWTLTVLDTVPTHTTPSLIATDNPKNYTTANLTCTNQTTADADGDVVTNIYNWLKNGASITVLNMPFDTDTGMADDYSGYNNQGTPNGDATWNTLGIVNGAYSFDGDDDYIGMNDAASLNFGLGNFTIEFWINATAQQNFKTVIGKSDGNPATEGFAGWEIDTRGTGNNGFRFCIADGINAGAASVSSETYSDGNWHHLVFVIDRSSGLATAYHNGSISVIGAKDISAVVGSVSIASDTRIGINAFNLVNDFTGSIDNVKLYNKALSAEQIELLYKDSKDGYSNHSTIASAETAVAETWSCKVTPTDNYGDGIVSTSVPLDIQEEIVSCGTDITSDTTLTSSITGCVNNYIINISTNNVMFDCAGYTIQGTLDYGVYVTADNVTVKNCNISMDGADGDRAIFFTGASDGNITNNTIYATDDDGIYLTGSSNNYITDNVVSIGGVHGAWITASSNNNIIDSNNFTVLDQSILIFSSSTSNTLSNNNFTATGSDGIRITSGCDNNIIYDNFVSADSSAIDLDGQDNILLNNNLTSTNNFIIDDASEGTKSNTLIYNNSNGEVRWDVINSTISGGGTIGLVTAINITNNLTKVDSSFDGLNQSANLTFFDVVGITIPSAFRNGIECPLSICSGVVNLGGDDYKFNVSQFTNYSVGEGSPPTFINNNSNTSTPNAFDSVLLYANWTDGTDLDYAILETNETGVVRNYSGGTYNSTFDINLTSGQTWSNFTWDNDTMLGGTVVSWKIYANDSAGNENVTGSMTFTVGTATDISLTTNNVKFLGLKTNTANDTTDENPLPFVVRNDGNVNINISVITLHNYTFTSAANDAGPGYFEAKCGDNETSCPLGSITTFTPLHTEPQVFIYNLPYTSTIDEMELEINITAPTEELPGAKNNTLTFTGSAA